MFILFCIYIYIILRYIYYASTYTYKIFKSFKLKLKHIKNQTLEEYQQLRETKVKACLLCLMAKRGFSDRATNIIGLENILFDCE